MTSGRPPRPEETPDVSQLSAGRELDALVAERVMGWRYTQNSPDPKKWFCREYGNRAGWWQRPGREGWGCATCSPCPEYSENIAAAWEVVEKCKLSVLCMEEGDWHAFNEEHNATAETAPRAICLAALRAVGAPQTTQEPK